MQVYLKVLCIFLTFLTLQKVVYVIGLTNLNSSPKPKYNPSINKHHFENNKVKTILDIIISDIKNGNTKSKFSLYCNQEFDYAGSTSIITSTDNNIKKICNPIINFDEINRFKINKKMFDTKVKNNIHEFFPHSSIKKIYVDNIEYYQVILFDKFI